MYVWELGIHNNWKNKWKIPKIFENIYNTSHFKKNRLNKYGSINIGLRIPMIYWFYALFFSYLYSAKIKALTMQQSKNRMSFRLMKNPGAIMVNNINDTSTVPSFNRLGEIINITGRQTETSNDKANRINRACSSSLRGTLLLLLTCCGWIILRFLEFWRLLSHTDFQKKCHFKAHTYCLVN